MNDPQGPNETAPQAQEPNETVPQTQELNETVPQTQGPNKTVPQDQTAHPSVLQSVIQVHQGLQAVLPQLCLLFHLDQDSQLLSWILLMLQLPRCTTRPSPPWSSSLMEKLTTRLFSWQV